MDFCQPNANKFYTKAECEEYCGKPDVDGEKKKSAIGTGDVHISAILAQWKDFFFLIFQIQSTWLQIDFNEDLFQL